jgi:hypothetical protein
MKGSTKLKWPPLGESPKFARLMTVVPSGCVSPMASKAVYVPPEFFQGVFFAPERLVQIQGSNKMAPWPGGLDLAPDAMYEDIMQAG